MMRLSLVVPVFSLLFLNSFVRSDEKSVEWLFWQKLDHFDSTNNLEWQQHYFVINAYFNNKTRDGPVFLMIGGERSSNLGLLFAGGMWTEWAKKYSALCIYFEHRFYGSSWPINIPNASTQNLKYLNSEQALADLANFISYQKRVMNLTNNKWILFGGFYAGNLAAWFRLKYPHLAFGAVASSAPILAKMNFKEYYEGVTNALKTSKQSLKCTDAVQQGTTALIKLTQSKATCGNVTKLFKLCAPLNCADVLQVSFTIQKLIFSVFGMLVQFNNILPYSFYSPNIDSLCAIMTDSKLGPPVNRLANLTNTMAEFTAFDCNVSNYTGYIASLKSVDLKSAAVIAGDRQWFYQLCTEFGYLQTSDSTRQPFGNLFPLGIVIREQCTDIFGPNFNDQMISSGVNWTNIKYGGLDLVLNRTVFVSGSLDPWFALGMTTNQTGNLAIVIKGASHCADMYSTSKDDSAALAAAKLQIEAIVKSWIYKK